MFTKEKVRLVCQFQHRCLLLFNTVDKDSNLTKASHLTTLYISVHYHSVTTAYQRLWIYVLCICFLYSHDTLALYFSCSVCLFTVHHNHHHSSQTNVISILPMGVEPTRLSKQLILNQPCIPFPSRKYILQHKTAYKNRHRYYLSYPQDKLICFFKGIHQLGFWQGRITRTYTETSLADNTVGKDLNYCHLA